MFDALLFISQLLLYAVTLYRFDPCQPCCESSSVVSTSTSPKSSSVAGTTTSSSSSSSSGDVICNCDQCPDCMAECWQFSVSGITNQDCTLCDDYNGTFLLEHNTNCQFSVNETVSICNDPSGTRWTMNHDGVWYLQMQRASHRWDLTSGNPCNNDTLTFTLQQSSAASPTDCQDLPDTINVEPRLDCTVSSSSESVAGTTTSQETTSSSADTTSSSTPPDCCPAVDLPDTLTATITDSVQCDCSSGAEITLIRQSNTSTWKGEGAFGSCGSDFQASSSTSATGGHRITVTFSCEQEGAGCESFDLSVGITGDGCTFSADGIQEDGCACDPLSVVYLVDAIDSEGNPSGCCEHSSSGVTPQFQVTVTE